MKETIRIKIDDSKRSVYKKDYIKAKTKQLQEFGYASLTEKETEEQLNKALKGDTDLTVIGMFIKEDIDIN
jgi:hypothetical protein